jgi:hypothetical protein
VDEEAAETEKGLSGADAVATRRGSTLRSIDGSTPSDLWKQHVRKKEGSLAQRLKSAYNLHFRPGSSSLFLDKDSRTHANPI